MKKWITILVGVFTLQFILIVAVNLTGKDYGVFQADEKLLSFNREAINRLRITDSVQQSVLLEKKAGEWILPEAWDYPVDNAVLNRLLDNLFAINKGWPVATSSSAAERFKTAESDFERKIVFLTNGQVQATLYIGSSPGFRKTHVRLHGEDAVYTATLETWEASGQTDHWLKKDILKLNADEIAQLTMSDFELHRSDQALLPSNLSEHENPNTAAIQSLIQSLIGLTIQSVLGIEDKPDYRLDQPTLAINVQLNNGDELNYRFSKPEENSTHYFLKRSDLPYYFTVAEYLVKSLAEMERSKLIRENNEDEPAS